MWPNGWRPSTRHASTTIMRCTWVGVGLRVRVRVGGRVGGRVGVRVGVRARVKG